MKGAPWGAAAPGGGSLGGTGKESQGASRAWEGASGASRGLGGSGAVGSGREGVRAPRDWKEGSGGFRGLGVWGSAGGFRDLGVWGSAGVWEGVGAPRDWEGGPQVWGESRETVRDPVGGSPEHGVLSGPWSRGQPAGLPESLLDCRHGPEIAASVPKHRARPRKGLI